MSAVEKINPPIADSQPRIIIKYEEQGPNPWEHLVALQTSSSSELSKQPPASEDPPRNTKKPKRKWPLFSIILSLLHLAGFILCSYPHASVLICQANITTDSTLCHSIRAWALPHHVELPHWAGFPSFSIRQKIIAEIFTSDEHQPLSTVALQMAHLGDRARSLIAIIQTNGTPQRYKLEEELASFESNASQTAISLRELDARKTGASHSIVFVNNVALQTTGFTPPSNYLDILHWLNINLWSQRSGPTTVFEAAMVDHLTILSDLHEGFVHADNHLKEQKEGAQRINDVAALVNSTLRAAPSLPLTLSWLVGCIQPTGYQCGASQAVIGEIMAFAGDAIQRITMAQAELQTARSQIKYYQEQPDKLNTTIPYDTQTQIIWEATKKIEEKSIR